MKAPSSNTHFIILAGLLGSGKTTLLEQLLANNDLAADTAIIINEAGAVNIDGSVLMETDNGLKIETLSNGCVCCSLSNSLTFTIEELFTTRAKMDMPPFQRIVLECSGLSLPGQVMRSLADLAHLKMSVSIVCTYDCSRPPLIEEQFDVVTSQLVVANTVVFTKLDIATEDQIKAALKLVGCISPLATIINQPDPIVRSQDVFLVPAQSPKFTVPLARYIADQRIAHPRIRVHLASLDDDIEIEDVMDWLDNVSGVLGERLLRSKALVHSNGGIALLQSVGTTFAAPRALREQPRQTNLAIIIAKDCKLEELDEIPRTFGALWISDRNLPA